MTNEEAIKRLQIGELIFYDGKTSVDNQIALAKSIDALEKQIPKPVEIGEGGSHEFVYCPNCGKHIVFIGHVKHCKHCGQALAADESANK